MRSTDIGTKYNTGNDDDDQTANEIISSNATTSQPSSTAISIVPRQQQQATRETDQRRRDNHHPSSTSSDAFPVKEPSKRFDPTAILENAEKDDRITSLHFVGLNFTKISIAQLIRLLESRDGTRAVTADAKGARSTTVPSSGWNVLFFSNCQFPAGASPAIGLKMIAAAGGGGGGRRVRHHPHRPGSSSAAPATRSSCEQLAVALAKIRVRKLVISDSVALTTALFERAGRLQNVERLVLRQRRGLTDDQCQALGKLVSSSKGLKELSLRGTPIPSGALLAPGLAISHHLETLVLAESYLSAQSLGDLVLSAAPDQKAINYGLVNTAALTTSIQATSRLLSSPRSHLTVLDVSHLLLRDNHMEVLAPLLTDPNSKLEQLNLSFNQIGDRGLAIFCQHLPNMRKLKSICLSRNPFFGNPWKNGKVLCDAMQKNTSIEYLDSSFFSPEQATKLRHYTMINRGGRHLIQQRWHNNEASNGGDNADPPLGLWAKILERAGSIHYYERDQEHAKANAIFYLLTHGPIFFDQP